jgi:hypothetical protein
MSDNFRFFPTVLTFGKIFYKTQILNLDAKSSLHVKCDILKARSVYLSRHEDGKKKTRYDK